MARDPCADCPPVGSIVVDPRRLEAIVDFSLEVAEVAGTLTNLGLTDEAGRLLDALDRLDIEEDP